MSVGLQPSVQLDITLGPPPQSTPEDVLAELSAAIASNDENAFTNSLTSYATSERCKNIRHLQPIMDQAIDEDKPFFVSEMLYNGLRVKHWIVVKHAVLAKAKGSLEAIIKSGWDINQPTSSVSPSVLQCRPNALALDHGADLNRQALLDVTPKSCMVAEASPHLIRVLLDRGADVHKGELLQHALSRSTDIVKVLTMLLDRGAPLNAIMYEKHSASLAMYCIVDFGTPLHTASRGGQTDTVRFLLEKGADPTIGSLLKGLTAKELAEAAGHARIVEILTAAEDKARQ